MAPGAAQRARDTVTRGEQVGDFNGGGPSFRVSRLGIVTLCGRETGDFHATVDKVTPGLIRLGPTILHAAVEGTDVPDWQANTAQRARRHLEVRPDTLLFAFS